VRELGTRRSDVERVTLWSLTAAIGKGQGWLQLGGATGARSPPLIGCGRAVCTYASGPVVVRGTPVHSCIVPSKCLFPSRLSMPSRALLPAVSQDSATLASRRAGERALHLAQYERSALYEYGPTVGFRGGVHTTAPDHQGEVRATAWHETAATPWYGGCRAYRRRCAIACIGTALSECPCSRVAPAATSHVATRHTREQTRALAGGASVGPNSLHISLARA